ncbi:MAG: SAM-dependent methyltransferase, partial [Rhodobacterales bacterium 12-65-15]
TDEADITEAVAPSIDLEQQLFNVIGHGVTRISDEVRAKKPGVHWALARLIGLFLSRKRRANLMQRLTGQDRTSTAFCHYNRYLILRLSVKA